MPVPATKTYKRLHGLTIEQQNAIDLLVQGKTDQEAADGIGAHRVTVTNWRNHDPFFQAGLNRRRAEVWGSAAERLRSLLAPALDVLEEELANATGANRWRMALDLLKLAGLDAGRSLHLAAVGTTDPEIIIDGLARAERRDPLDNLREAYGDGPVTDAERESALGELVRRFDLPDFTDGEN